MMKKMKPSAVVLLLLLAASVSFCKAEIPNQIKPATKDDDKVNKPTVCCKDPDCIECEIKESKTICMQNYPFYEEEHKCIATGRALDVACCSDSQCTQCGEEMNTRDKCAQDLFPFYLTADTDSEGEGGQCKAAAAYVYDNHVKTFSGHWYDFDGECDLLLLHAPEFEPDAHLTIQIRTKTRKGLSWIASAAVQIGKDILQVASWGEYMHNGVVSASVTDHTKKTLTSAPPPPPGTPRKKTHLEMQGFRIHQHNPNPQRYIFDIVIGRHENITISTFKHHVAVKIVGGSHNHFASATGLLGNWNGEIMGRNGHPLITTEFSQFEPALLAKEWQVRPKKDGILFRSAQGTPQFPQQCAVNNKKSNTQKINTGSSDSSNNKLRIAL